MTSPGAQSSQSNEILESPVAKRLYQQRVSITMTRREAQTLQEIVMRAASNQDLAATMDPTSPSKGTMRRAKSIWNKTSRAIERRDARMRQKVYKTESNLDDTELTIKLDLGDRPLLGLGED